MDEPKNILNIMYCIHVIIKKKSALRHESMKCCKKFGQLSAQM